MIEYRILPTSEYERIAPIFAEFGCAPPEDGWVFVGEEAGEVVSLQCVHKVIHAGPVWIRPDHRGNGVWPEMQEHVERALGEGAYYYQFGTDKNERRLQELGLEPLGWRVWGKRL